MHAEIQNSRPRFANLMLTVELAFVICTVFGSFELVSAADDNVNELRLARQFKGHSGDILAARFSSDGSKIVTSSMDQTARIWNAGSGEELLRINTSHERVDCVSFTPTDRFVAAAGKEPFGIRLYDSTTGIERQRVPIASHVRDLVFSPNGRWLFAGTDPEGLIIRYATNTWKETLVVRAPSPVFSLAVSPDGITLASANVTDESVGMWNTGSGKEIKKLGPHGTRVRSVAFSPDGTKIASTCAPDSGEDASSNVFLWDVSTGREITRINAGHSRLGRVQFFPDGKFLLAGSTDSVFIWRVSHQSVVRKLNVASYIPICSPNGKSLLTAEGDVLSLWQFEP